MAAAHQEDVRHNTKISNTLVDQSCGYNQTCSILLIEQAECHRDWPLYDDVFYPPPLRLESRKPLWRDLQSIDVTSRWREDWQSATVVNSTLVIGRPQNPTSRFWSSHTSVVTAESFSDRPGPLYNACHKKWGFTDNELCDCGEIQTMSHIVRQLLSIDQVWRRSTALTWSRRGCRRLADNMALSTR